MVGAVRQMTTQHGNSDADQLGGSAQGEDAIEVGADDGGDGDG